MLQKDSSDKENIQPQSKVKFQHKKPAIYATIAKALPNDVLFMHEARNIMLNSLKKSLAENEICDV